MTTTDNKIAVTLSDRSPVRIDPEQWPIVAEATRHDNQYRSQANNVWHITVREHADGRRIVYGSHDSGPGGSYAGFRAKHAGYLVDGDADLIREYGNLPDGRAHTFREPDEEATIRAIRRVAGVVGDDQLGAECIAALPAEELA